MAIALFGTALCTACEKEEETTNVPQTITATNQATMDALLREAYATAHNDAPIMITVASREAEAYRNRCRELFGGSVLIVTQLNEIDHHATDITLIATHSALAKKLWKHALDTKAIPFSTQDKTEMDKWVYEMRHAGYYVIESYDEKTGTYHGVAYTEEEWDKLQ